MNGKNINFNNEKIKKKRLLQQKQKKINIDDIGVNKILVSKRETYDNEYNSFKCFIGHNDDVIRPLYLFLSQRLAILINLIKII